MIAHCRLIPAHGSVSDESVGSADQSGLTLTISAPPAAPSPASAIPPPTLLELFIAFALISLCGCGALAALIPLSIAIAWVRR